MKWHINEPAFDYQKDFQNVDPISAWVGHKYFAYDLVSNLKPKLVVELGTHKGTSFFSMCQAVKDHNLKTKLVAVDTWEGDKHAGFYDDSIYNIVKEITETTYHDVDIKLLRTIFDNAVSEFKNGTIDLLHIDGLHTYIAVKHDFLNWVEKVSKDGIILFHDISENSADFGVYKLWKELKKTYDTLEFDHEHGLGILFKSKSKNIKIDIQEMWQKYYELKHTHHLLIKSNLETPQILADLEVKYLSTKNDLKQEYSNLLPLVKEMKISTKNKEKLYNLIINSKFFKTWQLFCSIRKVFYEI